MKGGEYMTDYEMIQVIFDVLSLMMTTVIAVVTVLGHIKRK